MNREPVGALGEVFMRLPFLRALRAWAPEARITIVPGIGGASFWEELVRPISASLVDENYPRPAAAKPRSFDLVFNMEGHPQTSFLLKRLARDRFFTTALRGWLNFPHLPICHGKCVAKCYLGLLKQATGTMPASHWPWPVPEHYRQAAECLLPAGAD